MPIHNPLSVRELQEIQKLTDLTRTRDFYTMSLQVLDNFTVTSQFQTHPREELA
jgi:hypothetical protein